MYCLKGPRRRRRSEADPLAGRQLSQNGDTIADLRVSSIERQREVVQLALRLAAVWRACELLAKPTYSTRTRGYVATGVSVARWRKKVRHAVPVADPVALTVLALFVAPTVTARANSCPASVSPASVPETTSFYNNDKLLGPAELPKQGPVAKLLAKDKYDRFGGMPQADWDRTFINRDDKNNPTWRWPPTVSGFKPVLVATAVEVAKWMVVAWSVSE